jgi:hypothetical protein
MIDVERSLPAPESLAAKRNWDGEDVKQRLLADFLGKCYLTEELLLRGNFEIDHFCPQAQDQFPELKFEWANLFPASPQANLRRRRKWPEGGLLDPSAGEDVEGRLLQWLDEDRNPRFIPRDSNDSAAANSADELDHLHNHSNPKAADLRDAIRAHTACPRAGKAPGVAGADAERRNKQCCPEKT